VAPAKQVIGSGKGGLIRADLEILTDAAGIGPDELRDYLQNAVTLGLRARLAMAGITGGQYIEIEMSKDAPPPIDLPWKPEGLYIPGESSTLDQMLSNLRSTLRKIESLDLNAMVDRANAVLTRLDNVLRDDAPMLQSMLTSLKSTLDNLDRLVGSLRDDPARLLFAKPPQSVIPQGGQP
jgi:paraquat-inducible protein B